MTIGEYIIKYRSEHDKSQREFARDSGISNSLVSMLEKNANPKTGKPIELSIVSYRKIAKATGVTVDELFKILGPDAPVQINSGILDIISPVYDLSAAMPMITTRIAEGETRAQILEREHQDELKLVKIFRSITKEGQDYLLQQAEIAKKMFER